MADEGSIEEELERELSVVSTKAIVWIAVAAGIGMAVVSAIRALRGRQGA